MERLKNMKECFIAQIQSQLGNLSQVDAQELGEVVDMVKDMEEAIYYATITKAMEEKENEHGKHAYYTERYYAPMYLRDMDRYDGRMYYNGNGSGGGNGASNYGASSYNSNGGGSSYNMSGSKYYTEREYPIEFRDMREGRSPLSRKMYMESKEMHHDKSKQIKELENYMKELSDDIVEMIDDASPEEKQILQQKLTALASKIH